MEAMPRTLGQVVRPQPNQALSIAMSKYFSNSTLRYRADSWLMVMTAPGLMSR